MDKRIAVQDNTEIIKLHCIFHIEYKDIELITKNTTNADALFAGAASLPFQYGGLVNKASSI